MASQEVHVLGPCADTTYHSEESLAFCFGSSPVDEDRDQVQENLISLFDKKFSMEETASYGDQEMQLSRWGQFKYDATPCLDHSPYTALEECTEQLASASCVTMKAYQGYSSIVDSPAVEGQPSVQSKMHQNGQMSSLQTTDDLKGPSQLHLAVESEASSSAQKYLDEDNDMQYAESYMITGYETFSETL